METFVSCFAGRGERNNLDPIYRIVCLLVVVVISDAFLSLGHSQVKLFSAEAEAKEIDLRIIDFRTKLCCERACNLQFDSSLKSITCFCSCFATNGQQHGRRRICLFGFVINGHDFGPTAN